MMRFRSIFIGAAACALGSCATINTDKTVPAFASAASSSTQAFSAIRDAEAQTYFDATLHAALAVGTVESDNCWSPGFDAAKCEIVMTVGKGRPVSQGAAASNGLKLAQALDAYGKGLQELASARDITDRQSAIQKLAKGIGGLASLAGIPGIEPGLNLIALLEKDAALHNRRAALASIAARAEAPLNEGANLLQKQAELLQRNIMTNASQTVADTEARLALANRDQAYPVAKDFVTAVNTEKKAGSLKVNIAKPLKEAHAAMLTSLRNPKASLATALTQIKELDDQFNKLKDAFESSSSS